MRILLDTHALLWALDDSRELSPAARNAIEDPANEVLVNATSAIEIAIKKSLGKLVAPDGLLDAVEQAGFVATGIGFAEADALQTLPWHHNDPFDRLLVAHALVRGAPIVTRDPQISRYQVQVIW